MPTAQDVQNLISLTTDLISRFDNLISQLEESQAPALLVNILRLMREYLSRLIPEFQLMLSWLIIKESIQADIGQDFTGEGMTLEDLNELGNRIQVYWNRDSQLLPIDTACFSALSAPGIVYPAQLSTDNLIVYMRCIIEEDKQRWVDAELSGPDDWNRLMAQHLPDLNPKEIIISIDPFDPQPFTEDYTESPLIEGLWLPYTNDALPFLPSSLITVPEEGRQALAKATLDMWSFLGFLQTIEEISNWINSKEHSVFGGDNSIDQNARQRMIEFIHYTYYRLTEPDEQIRRTIFVSAWSVALFQVRVTGGIAVNDRTYNFFLNQVLVPTQPLFVFNNNLDWTNGTQTGYSTQMLNAIAAGADRTFGSSEIDNSGLSGSDIALFKDTQRQGVLWYEYIPNSAGTDGLYLMTSQQFGCAQAIVNGQTSVQSCIDELS